MRKLVWCGVALHLYELVRYLMGWHRHAIVMGWYRVGPAMLNAILFGLFGVVGVLPDGMVPAGIGWDRVSWNREGWDVMRSDGKDLVGMGGVDTKEEVERNGSESGCGHVKNPPSWQSTTGKIASAFDCLSPSIAATLALPGWQEWDGKGWHRMA